MILDTFIAGCLATFTTMVCFAAGLLANEGTLPSSWKKLLAAMIVVWSCWFFIAATLAWQHSAHV